LEGKAVLAPAFAEAFAFAKASADKSAGSFLSGERKEN
jgi:hypothetical protein